MSTKNLYGLLAITAVISFFGVIVFYQQDPGETVPVEMKTFQEMSERPSESELLEKVVEEVETKLDGEKLEKLFQTILTITSMENEEDIVRLKDTLTKHKKDVNKLLTLVQSYQGTEGASPKTILNPKATITHTEKWEGHSLPIMVANPAGGVGNIMGQYATVFGLYKIWNITSFITPMLSANLKRFYDHTTLKPIDLGNKKEERIARGWIELHKDHPTAPSTYFGLQLGAAGLLGPERFFTSGCPVEVQLFSAFRDELKQEFKFNDYLLNNANDILAGFAKRAVLDKKLGPPTFVGIHIRLKDYVNHMFRRWGVPNVDDKYNGYLRRAIRFYQERHENTVFVLVSDDADYITNFADRIKDTNIFPSHGTQGEDMCLLTRCNQSIFTLGTFGFWSSFLKDSGNTIYPDVKDESAKTYHFTRKVIEESKLDDFIPLPF